LQRLSDSAIGVPRGRTTHMDAVKPPPPPEPEQSISTKFTNCLSPKPRTRHASLKTR
jgi:hypothetical protein